MQLSAEKIIQTFPRCNRSLVISLVPFLNLYLPTFGIDTKLEISHFLAQAAKETDSFQVLKEYASGADYEGRTDLGNVYKGDGIKFKGHGIFMTTGRTNHAIAGKKIYENDVFGEDRKVFVNDTILKHPELLCQPQWAVASACIFWLEKDLSNLCKSDVELVTIKRKIDGKWSNYECYPIEAISRKVNGGLNGFSDRKLFYRKISQWS
ncbi:hypothetical protein [Emticicia sp. BO119]|uniref:glycoside hydrolase family 19 protein n=1 Tax=Emticicia sp. BO119 TaxID=2757768 RepID=UPI0015F07C19|nr:hypothetical protein [Emticicia sp. BO119]MBA4849031.1 hypothetical protein [Emticicia sp. BO119]